MTTVAASTNTPHSTAKAWIVIICASLFFFYEFVQMNMFNTLNGDLMRAFNIDAGQVSNLSAFYFYADVLFLFPAGIILDHFSTRKLIAVALSVCTVATLAFSFADSYFFAAAMRTLSGIGAAFCLLSAMRLATRWIPSKHLALATGVIVTMAMLGGMVAQTPIAMLKAEFGWRHAMFLDGLFGILFVIIILWQVRDFPPGTQQQSSEKALHDIGFWPGVFAAWKNAQNWLAGLYTSLLNLPIMIIGALWGSEFLQQVHHFSQDRAGVIDMMLFLGTIIGSPIIGLISDSMGRRKLPMVISAIISLFLVLVIMYSPHASFFSLVALYLLLGFFTSGQILSYPLIAESNPNALAGTATGWAAVLIMSGGAFGQPLFGWLLDLHWHGAKLNHIPFYTAADYHFAWLLFPLMFVLALFITLFIKETHCKPFEAKKNPST